MRKFVKNELHSLIALVICTCLMLKEFARVWGKSGNAINLPINHLNLLFKMPKVCLSTPCRTS